MEPTKDTKKLNPPASTEIDPNSKLAGLHILIVEDMGMIVLELRRMLEEMGCSIVGVASRLSEAMKLAQNTEHLDGVLLDLNLASQSSYSVAEILRERGIPFIIMSGYDTVHIRADCANDAHLQKPFNQDDLAKKMLSTFPR
ncbi:MAG: response regulator [Phycisphaerales bacterium]